MNEPWFHLAIVNDGRHSVVYVDSSELLRNPANSASSPVPSSRRSS
ncbi:hypothetical protein ABZX12_32710 [Kribbella sp. NPDC003505]